MDYQELFLAGNLGIRIHNQDEIDQVNDLCVARYGNSYLDRHAIGYEEEWTHLKKISGHGCLTLARNSAIPSDTIDFVEFMAIFGNVPEEDVDGVPDELL